MTPQTLEMLEKLRATKPYWPELGIKRMALFGSYARGEATPDSDVDLLAEFEGPTGFFALFNKERKVSELVGIKAEIHSLMCIDPEKNHTHRYIAKDMLYVE